MTQMPNLDPAAIMRLYHRWTPEERWGYKPGDQIGHMIFDTVESLCLEVARLRAALGTVVLVASDRPTQRLAERALSGDGFKDGQVPADTYHGCPSYDANGACFCSTGIGGECSMPKEEVDV